MATKAVVLNLYGRELNPVKSTPDARKMVKKELEKAAKYGLKQVGWLDGVYKDVQRPVFRLNLNKDFKVLSPSTLAAVVDHNDVRTPSGKKLRGKAFQKKEA